jgi:ribosomal subunit interface protein
VVIKDVTGAMKLTWNIVTKNLRPHDQLQQKLRQKIAKLEQHLQHFPPDAVHLQIGLIRHPRRGQFTASLTLRVPSNILHAEKAAADPIPAFDLAIKILLRELATLKAGLRRKSWWRRRDRAAKAGAGRLTVFAETPLPAGVGPQTFTDSVSDLLQRYYSQLNAYTVRQLERHSEENEMPRDTIDVRAVIAEVTRRALANPAAKPDEASYLVWFYLLVRQELRRRYRDWARQELGEVHCEEPQALSLAAERAEGYDVERPREVVEQPFDPTLAETGDLVADLHALPPDEELEHKDFIDYLHRTAAVWPKFERDIFELHFIEGFEPDEVAMLEQRPASEIRSGIESVQDRLRQVVAAAAAEGIG